MTSQGVQSSNKAVATEEQLVARNLPSPRVGSVQPGAAPKTACQLDAGQPAHLQDVLAGQAATQSALARAAAQAQAQLSTLDQHTADAALAAAPEALQARVELQISS